MLDWKGLPDWSRTEKIKDEDILKRIWGFGTNFSTQVRPLTSCVLTTTLSMMLCEHLTEMIRFSFISTSFRYLCIQSVDSLDLIWDDAKHVHLQIFNLRRIMICGKDDYLNDDVIIYWKQLNSVLNGQILNIYYIFNSIVQSILLNLYNLYGVWCSLGVMKKSVK